MTRKLARALVAMFAFGAGILAAFPSQVAAAGTCSAVASLSASALSYSELNRAESICGTIGTGSNSTDVAALARVPAPAPGRVQPGDLGVSVPHPEPALPVGVDPYDPPVLAVSSSGPAIAEMLRTAGPDESLSMSGAGFISGTTKFDVFSQTASSAGAMVSVVPLRINSVAATVLLPASLPSWSMYLVWPNNGGVRGKAFAVNRTEAWWIGPKSATIGQTISIFGRNLAKSNGTLQSFVYIKRATGAGVWVTPTAVNPYKVDIRVPSLAVGSYDVWIHNGHGGRLGWSGPLKLSVISASPWAALSARSFNVKDYGAVGDGVADDGAAIQSALNAARANAPSTLHFPSGTYIVRKAFSVPSNVRWLGDGRDASLIKLVAPLGGPMMTGSPRNALFENLTINGDGQVNASLIRFDRASNVKFLNSRLSAWGAQATEISADGLYYDGMDIISSGSFTASSSQMFINDTTFRMTNDGEQAIANWGGTDISFTGNHLYNADESRSDGNGIGRLFVAQGHFGSSRNIYFGGNATHNSAPRDCKAVDCNKGEQILFEFGSTHLKGKASATSPNTVSFPSLSIARNAGGTDVVVAGGRGVGQHRRIISVSNNTATLDRPWNVIPDTSTSLFLVTSIAEKAAVYANTFEGRASYSLHDSDSTAVLVWGTCYDVVIDDNAVSQMRHGIMVNGTVGTGRGVSMSAPFFILTANNQISNSSNGLYTGLTFGYDVNAGLYGSLGNVYRNNTINNVAHIGIAVDTWDSAGGQIDATVFEHNRITNAPYGFVAALKLIWTDTSFRPTPGTGTHLINTILYDNSFDRGTALPSGSIGFRADSFQTFLNRGSTWTGFATGNGGPP